MVQKLFEKACWPYTWTNVTLLTNGLLKIKGVRAVPPRTCKCLKERSTAQYLYIAMTQQKPS